MLLSLSICHHLYQCRIFSTYYQSWHIFCRVSDWMLAWRLFIMTDHILVVYSVIPSWWYYNLRIGCIVSTFFSYPITKLYITCAGHSVLKEIMKYQCCYRVSWERERLYWGRNSWKYGMLTACISVLHFCYSFQLVEYAFRCT